MSGSGHHLTQDFQPLCAQLTSEKINPCQVAVRPSKAGNKTKPYRVSGSQEYDGIVVVATLAANAGAVANAAITETRR